VSLLQEDGMSFGLSEIQKGTNIHPVGIQRQLRADSEINSSSEFSVVRNLKSSVVMLVQF
jgi:hypothetical protein